MNPAATTAHFLTLTSNVNPLTFEYNAAATTEADIGTHTVDFTVAHDEYTAVRTPHSDSFTFTISCPTLATSDSLDQPIEPYTDYNVASGAVMVILLPAITVNPASCFSISSFEVVDAATGVAAPVFINASLTQISIFTEDRSNVGTHVFTIRALLNNGEVKHAHDF